MPKPIKISECGFILDHRLNHQAIIPATWYLEIMLSQGVQSFSLPLSLMNIHYTKAVIQNQNSNSFYDLVSHDGQYDLLIKMNEEWELCASGQPQTYQELLSKNSFNKEEILTRCPEYFNKEAYYTALNRLNYDFGPMHQGVQSIYVGTEEALGKIACLPELDTEHFLIHPAFLDACSHIGLALLPPIEKKDVFITTAQDRVTVLHPFPNTVWCYAKKIKADENTLLLDFLILNESNELLAEIQGYQLQKIPIVNLFSPENETPFYKLFWEEQTLPAALNNRPELQTIILDLAGEQCVLPEISNAKTTALSVFLPDSDAIYENNLESIDRLLTLCKELYRRQINELYRFIIVLNQAANLPNRQKNTTLNTACVPGFCRSLQQEFPHWHVTCLYTNTQTRQEALQLIDLELSVPFAENDIAYQLTNRYVTRLRPFEPHSAQLPQYYKLAYKKGALQEMHWVAHQPSAPQDHEIEIEVFASSINFRDVLILLNQYPEADAHPGIDGSGVITRVGKAVTSLKPGDEVMFIGQHDFANTITLHEYQAIKKPAHLHLAAAASIPVVFITAFYALVTLGKLQKSQSILIHSAAGGVGTAAILIAKQLGATIYATAHPSKWTGLYESGVTACYNSRTLEFAEEIPQQSLDLVLNNLIGDYIPLSLSLLKNKGIFIEIGNKAIWSQEQMEKERPDVHYWPLHVLNEQKQNPAAFHDNFLQMRDFIENGHLSIAALKAYAPEHIHTAFQELINAKHVGKLIITHQHAQPFIVDPNASYLITGGLGGIGRALTDYLLEHQAGRIYLLSRHQHESPPQDERIVLLTGDVAIEDDVIKVMHEIAGSTLPLKGIFHAAGISDDNIVPNLSRKQIKEVLQAKLLGAWHLHQQSESLSLDHFVLFSSVVSLLGTPGLANYAAANGFLDQLACYRHFIGLPALSIHWGPWAVGILQKRGDEVRQSWQNQGFSILESQEALAYFEQGLKSKEYELAIMPVNWDKLFSYYTKEYMPSLFAEIMEHAPKSEQPKAADSEFLNTLHAAPDSEKKQKLMHFLQQEVEALTGTKISNLNLSFTELGITSLSAVEMTQRIGTALGLTLPQTLLFNYTRIAILADYLLVSKLHMTTQEKEEPKNDKSSATAITDELNDLTDKEVIDLLGDALKDLDDLL